MGGTLEEAFDAWERYCRSHDHEPWEEVKEP